MDEKYIIAIVIGIAAVLLLLIVFILKLYEHKNKLALQENNRQMSEQLLHFQSNLLTALHKDINVMHENTTTHLSNMEYRVNEQILKNLNSTNEAYTNVLKEMSKIDEAQKHLQNLSVDIHDLHTIFNDKKTRGIYGEMQLYSLLEGTFGESGNGFVKQYRLQNGYIVDAVIFGNEKLGLIPVDSKFPLENYNRLHEEGLSEMDKKRLMSEFRVNVKKHISDIANKYISEETSEFAYMFIPAEAIFSYINAYFPDLIEYSFERKVYLAGPSTLMAYITAIKTLYLEQKKNEQMKEIQEELGLLSVEFGRFQKRYEMVIKDVDKTFTDMRDLMITAHKITSRFHKIEQVELDTEKEDSLYEV